MLMYCECRRYRVGASRVHRDIRQLSPEPAAAVHRTGRRGRPHHRLGRGFAIGRCIVVVVVVVVAIAIIGTITHSPGMAKHNQMMLMMAILYSTVSIRPPYFLPLRNNFTLLHIHTYVHTIYLHSNTFRYPYIGYSLIIIFR